MNKILWTVLIAFTFSSLPIGGTAFASQSRPIKGALVKSGKAAIHPLHGKRAAKLASKLHRQKTLAKHALKHAHKKA